MARAARLISVGLPHHIVQRGNNKASVFIDREDKEVYFSFLRKYSKKWESSILAYCLMTNHIHLLVEPKNPDSLAKAMQGIAQNYAGHFNKRYRRTGRLWENRYFSSIVDNDSYLWAVIRYIDQNPVRANMVKNAENYRYSSARAHLNGEKDGILGRILFDDEQRKEYAEFIKEIPSVKELETIESLLKA